MGVPAATAAERSPWLLLQLADSAFPVGGFAHAGGLEAAWRLGIDDLGAWLAGALDHAASSQGPLTAAANEAPERLAELDALAEAWLSNHCARRASSVQGASWLAAAAAVAAPPALQAARDAVRRGNLHGHLAPCLGAAAAWLGLDREDTLRLLLFGQLRGWISAAVRLGALGPLAAQGLQASLAPALDAALGTSLSLGLDDLHGRSPLHDLDAAHHDRLYSRLFAT